MIDGGKQILLVEGTITDLMAEGNLACSTSLHPLLVIAADIIDMQCIHVLYKRGLVENKEQHESDLFLHVCKCMYYHVSLQQYTQSRI